MSASVDIPLPVLGSSGNQRRPRRPGGSRMEPRRFAVLLLVQLLMIVHVVQWLVMGTTITPIEPSESIQTVRTGVITVGFVFFLLAIGSTMVFGRFFCGWGCHVIFLQDWCGRILGRFGIRPRPFRSRLLRWMPLALALYMFVWPVAHRFLVAPWSGGAPAWPGWSWEVTTTEFWATFPGLMMSIPFLLVCGFLTVYLLGMKGYCTYACPYGGFFAPAEQVAPVRIRVTSDCEHCGHCTAACTSNVRVHEEVEAFGMVVDPGCMKCLDCVSTCPNDALYVGVGRPAISIGTEERETAVESGTIRPRFDLSWTEEIIFAIIAVGLLFSIRGAYSLPLLFASGVAACGTWIAWRGWRTLRDRNVSFHRYSLRRNGSIRPAGFVMIASAAMVIGFGAWTGAVNAAAMLAFHHDDQVEIPASIVFSESGYVRPEVEIIDHAEASLRWYERASFVADGGWSPIPAYRPMFAVRRAWLLSVLGRFKDALTDLDASIERIGMTEDLALGRSRLLRVLSPVEVDDWYGLALAEHPEWMRLRDERITWRLEQDSAESAIAEARAGLEALPDQLLPMRRLAVLLIEHGGPEGWQESAELTERTLEIAPENPNAWRALSMTRAKQGDFEASEAAMREAVRLSPGDWRVRHQFSILLSGREKWDEAEAELGEAIELWEQAGGADAGSRPMLPARQMGPVPEGF